MHLSVKKSLFIAFSVGLLLPGIFEPVFGIDCRKTLASLFGIGAREIAFKSYQNAKEANEIEKGALALLDIFLKSRKELGLSVAPLLTGSKEQVALKILRFELASHILKGNRNYAKAFAKELLWSAGPFIWRSLLHFWSLRGTGQRGQDIRSYLYAHDLDSMLTNAGISEDEFFRAAMAVAIPDSNAKVFRAYSFRILPRTIYPLVLSYFFHLGGIAPTDTSGSSFLPEYKGETYFQDIHVRGGLSFKDKKTYVIALKHPYSINHDLKDDPPSEDNPLTDDSFKIVMDLSESFDGGLVDSIESFDAQLSKAKDAEADVIILFFHGEPGKVFVGSVLPQPQQIHTRGFKPGTVFVFFACNIGNISDHELRSSQAFNIVKNLLSNNEGQIVDGMGVISVQTLISSPPTSSYERAFEFPLAKAICTGFGLTHLIAAEAIYNGVFSEYKWKQGFKTLVPATGEIKTVITR